MEERLADQLLLAIEDDLLMDSASAQFGLQASGQLGDLIEVPSYSRRRDLAFLVDPQADEGESLRQSIAQGAEAVGVIHIPTWLHCIGDEPNQAVGGSITLLARLHGCFEPSPLRPIRYHVLESAHG